MHISRLMSDERVYNDSMHMAPSEQEAERISSRLAELAGVMNVVAAEMVDLVGQADTSDAWCGFRSIEQWVLLQAGMSHPRAAKLVRVARLLRERPVLRAAFAGKCSGWLGWHPGVAVEEVGERGDGGDVVFAGGGEVAA